MLRMTITSQSDSHVNEVGLPAALTRLFVALNYINSSNHLKTFGLATMEHQPGKLTFGHDAHNYSITIETDNSEEAKLLELIDMAYVHLLRKSASATATDVAAVVLLASPSSGYTVEHRDELEQIRGREGLLAQVVVKAAAGENVLKMFLNSVE